MHVLFLLLKGLSKDSLYNLWCVCSLALQCCSSGPKGASSFHLADGSVLKVSHPASGPSEVLRPSRFSVPAAVMHAAELVPVIGECDMRFLILLWC